MNENYMTEMTVEEQQKVCGGDWYDAAFLYLEGLVLGFGLL